ncbi:hypothetical protein [Streptomyces palmae]|uniref:Uncharacterized protein n=1 Tax=Streptomyces palmae TaxID=1701085 RepID=A0A4Z0HAE0_9ACTN|nr:hypothetical protein [Streptomyces palmae]TGB10017.1 hypothetical protein E4099_13120 [Streptomyces palmae]
MRSDTGSEAAPSARALLGSAAPGREADGGTVGRPGSRAASHGQPDTWLVAQEVAQHHADALAAAVLPELRRRERRNGAPSWSRDAIGIPGMPPR